MMSLVMPGSGDMHEVQALLFDLDGTILDSDPLHRAAFAEILEPAGHDVTEAFFHRHIHGKKVSDIFSALMPGEDADLLDRKKEEIFRKRLAETDTPCTAGLEPLLTAARRLGIPCAIATNGSLQNAEAAVQKLHLGGYFAAIVAAEQVAAGKPAPDVYLAAARRVGADPARAIAFEDSVPGMKAAIDAGCRVFGLTTSLSSQVIMESGALAAISDFCAPELQPLLTHGR